MALQDRIDILKNKLGTFIGYLKEKFTTVLLNICKWFHKILSLKIGIGKIYEPGDVFYVTGYGVIGTFLTMWSSLFLGYVVVHYCKHPKMIKHDLKRCGRYIRRFILKVKQGIGWLVKRQAYQLHRGTEKKVEFINTVSNFLCSFLTSPAQLRIPMQVGGDAAARRYKGDLFLYHRLIELVFEIFPYYFVVLSRRKGRAIDDSWRIPFFKTVFIFMLNVGIFVCDRVRLWLAQDRYYQFYILVRRQRDYVYFFNEFPQPVYFEGKRVDWVSLSNKVDYYAMWAIFLTRRWRLPQTHYLAVRYKKIFGYYKKELLITGGYKDYARVIKSYEAHCLASGTIGFKEYLTDLAAGKTVLDWENEGKFMVDGMSVYLENGDKFGFVQGGICCHGGLKAYKEENKEENGRTEE